MGEGVKVLVEEPTRLVALYKPAGVLSHPNSATDIERALIRAPYSQERECFEWKWPDGSTGRLWLLNRLDSATSGAILLSRSEALALAIREQFRKKQVRKVYQALAFGVPAVPVQLWRDRLSIDKRGGQIRTSGAGSIPCECQMRLVRRNSATPPLSLLRLEPRTGRSHQLRVQCAMRHLPIVGDATYGDFTANRLFARKEGIDRLFLHSLETSFDYEWQGKRLHFSARAPLPVEFERCLLGR